MAEINTYNENSILQFHGTRDKKIPGGWYTAHDEKNKCPALFLPSYFFQMVSQGKTRLTITVYILRI